MGPISVKSSWTLAVLVLSLLWGVYFLMHHPKTMTVSHYYIIELQPLSFLLLSTMTLMETSLTLSLSKLGR